MSTLTLVRDQDVAEVPATSADLDVAKAAFSGIRSGQLEYEITGPDVAPVIAVLGGISASKHVTASPQDPRDGWWQNVVGPDRAIDTRKFRALSIDYLAHRAGQPPVTTEDQAIALAAALDHAGIDKLKALVGASYGGMVALAFGALFPARVDRLVVIGAAHESDPMATALRHLQRRVVELGTSVGRERDALSIARGIAMTSYLTPRYFEERVGAEGSLDAATLEDRIGRYLHSRGEHFADSWTSERYNSLSLSLDLHNVRPEDITVPTTVIAVSSDRLVPVAQSRELARRLGGRSQLIELDSVFGHDAFLGDWSRIGSLIEALLGAARERLS
jgi:homoserine O-acetyltransferase